MSARSASRVQQLIRLVRENGLGSVLRVFLVAACVPILMRLPLRRVQAVIEPRFPCRSAADEIVVQRTIRRVQQVLALGQPLVRTGCLTRGITFYYFLRRCGLPVELCFGMQVWNEGHTGHCWLVRAGEPFLEPEDPRVRFTEVCRIPRLPDALPTNSKQAPHP